MSYESHLQDERAHSRILNNPTDSDRLHGAAVDLSTRERVQALIDEYEDPEGHIEAAQATVDGIEIEFQRYQNQQQALGWGTPEAMPDEMAERHNRACARRDVLKAERDRLRQILDEWTEAEEKDRSGDILRQLGNMRITTDNDPVVGRRTAVDGQRLSLVDADGQVIDRQFNPRSNEALAQIPDGAFAIIDDQASPYDGMDLGSYRRVVSYIKEQREERKKTLLAENASRPVDERVPESQLIDRARRWRTSPWPPAWPDGAVDWKAEARESA